MKTLETIIEFKPKCALCNIESSEIQLVPPHMKPNGWRSWDLERNRQYNKYRKKSKHYLIYKGPGGSSGYLGTPIDEKRIEAIIKAFTEPYQYSLIREASFYDDAGFCEKCNCFYCPQHWNISNFGAGYCPKRHFKSLDPHF